MPSFCTENRETEQETQKWAGSVVDAAAGGWYLRRETSPKSTKRSGEAKDANFPVIVLSGK
jgi:hypothetical protein